MTVVLIVSAGESVHIERDKGWVKNREQTQEPKRKQAILVPDFLWWAEETPGHFFQQFK